MGFWSAYSLHQSSGATPKMDQKIIKLPDELLHSIHLIFFTNPIHLRFFSPIDNQINNLFWNIFLLISQFTFITTFYVCNAYHHTKFYIWSSHSCGLIWFFMHKKIKVNPPFLKSLPLCTTTNTTNKQAG